MGGGSGVGKAPGNITGRRRRKAMTLRKGRGKLIQIRFLEYIRPKWQKPDTSDPRIIFEAEEKSNGSTVKNTKEIPDISKNRNLREKHLETPATRYIYVFKKVGRKAILVDELVPFGKQGWFFSVNWYPRRDKGINKKNQKLKQSRIRPAGIMHQAYYLEQGREYYAFITQHQLPFKRIRELEKNEKDTLKKRATYFKTEDGDNSKLIKSTAANESQYVEVYLHDIVRLSRYFQKLYQVAHSRWVQFAAGNRAIRRRLGETTWQLTSNLSEQRNSDTPWGWINKDKLKTELKNGKKYLERLEKERDFFCKYRNKWYESEAFDEMIKDFGHDPDLASEWAKLQAHLLEKSVDSEPGQKYIDNIIKNKDWFKRWIEDPFKIVTGTAKIPMAVKAKMIEDNANTLLEYAYTKIKQLDIADAETEVVAVIKKFGVPEEIMWQRARGNKPNMRGKIDLKKTKVGSLAEYFEGKRLNQHRIIEKIKSEHKIQAGRFPMLGFSFSAISFMFAAKSLYDTSQKTKKKDGEIDWDYQFAMVSLIGAGAGTISSLENFAQLKLPKSKILTGPFFRGVAIIGTICDYIGGIKDIVQGVMKGDAALAVSGTLTALAGVTGLCALQAQTLTAAAGAEAALSGVTFMGLTAFSWTVVGLVLALLSAVIIYMFYEEPIEKWLKKTPWGKGYDKEKNLQKLQFDLHKLICDFSLRKAEYADAQPVDDYRSQITKLVNPYFLFMKFGHLPEKAIVNVEFRASIKEHSAPGSDSPFSGKVIFQKKTKIQIMPYMKSWAVLEGDNPKNYPPFEVLMAGQGKNKRYAALAMNLAKAEILDEYKALFDNFKKSGATAREYDDYVGDAIDYTCQLRLDVFGDGKLQLPPKGPVTLKFTEAKKSVSSSDYD